MVLICFLIGLSLNWRHVAFCRLLLETVSCFLSFDLLFYWGFIEFHEGLMHIWRSEDRIRCVFIAFHSWSVFETLSCFFRFDLLFHWAFIKLEACCFSEVTAWNFKLLSWFWFAFSLGFHQIGVILLFWGHCFKLSVAFLVLICFFIGVSLNSTKAWCFSEINVSNFKLLSWFWFAFSVGFH